MPISVKHRPLGVPWEARSNSWKEIDPKKALRELPGGGEELKQFVFVLDAIVQYYDAIANARDRGDPSVAAYVNVTGVPLRLRLLEIANAVTTGISRNQILTVDELDTFLKYSPMLGEYALSLGDQISAPYYARLRGLLLGILWYEAGGAGVRFRRYQLNMQIFSTGPSFTATGPAQDDVGLQPASSVAVYPPQSNYAPPSSNIPSGPYQPASYPPPYPPPASYPPGDTRTTTTNTVVNNADGSISKIVKTVTESDTVQELVKNVTQSDTVKQLVKTVTDSGTVEDLVTAAKSLVKDALAKGARGGQDSAPKADRPQSRRDASQEPATPRQKTPKAEEKPATPRQKTPKAEEKPPATPRQPAKPKAEEKPPATPRQKPAKQQDTAQEAAQKARDRAEKDAAAREAQLKKEYEEKLKEQLKQAAQKARDREAKKQEAAKTPPPAAKQPKQAKPTPPASPSNDPKPPKPAKQTPPTTPRGKKKK